MTTALLRKGRAAEAGILANRLLHQSSSNPQLKEVFVRWQQARQQREALLFRGGGNLSPNIYRERLKEFGRQADDQEKPACGGDARVAADPASQVRRYSGLSGDTTAQGWCFARGAVGRAIQFKSQGKR